MTDLCWSGREGMLFHHTGEPLVGFGGCDYLGLATHDAILDALCKGLGRYALSAGASRTTTGDTRAHQKAELRAAGFIGLPEAVLLPEGMLANIAAFQALSDCKAALIDERAHSSLRTAAAAAGIPLHTYRHNDATDAASKLNTLDTPALVATDTLFAATGDIAPVPELLEALRPDDRLLLDDCHGIGVLGPRGRGAIEQFAINDPRVIVTATLAKAMGVYGAIVAGPAPFAAKVRRSGAFVGTTPIPPALAAAADAAFEVHTCELDRLARLRSSTARVREALTELGLITNGRTSPSPVFAITIEPEAAMVRLHEELARRGHFVPLIGYPGGPAGRYLRLSVSAGHADDQIDRLLTDLADLAPALRPQAPDVEGANTRIRS